MIIVDTALAKRAAAGNPIKVGMVGAGYMARGIALQILTAMPGIRLVAISNRTLSQAERAYSDAGAEVSGAVSSVAALDQAIRDKRYVVTEDPMLLCQAGEIEAVIETTGDVEFGTRVAFEAIRNGKHIILMNAEVDASVGPMLKVYADRAGVVYTYTDGDEPGVAMNLYRFVQNMGYKPVLLGQVKGFLNRYRNPDTQKEFAEKHQIPIAKDKRGEAPFSVDANLLHSSSEGKVLEDPAEEADSIVYQRTLSPEEAPDKATYLLRK